MTVFSIFYIYSSFIFDVIFSDKLEQDGQTVSITGLITQMTVNKSQENVFTIKSEEGFNYQVHVTNANHLNPGDICIFNGKFYKPDPVSNKGDFDYLRYCCSENISGKIYQNENDIVKTGEQKFQKFVYKQKSAILSRATCFMDNTRSNVATALISGQYTYKDEIIENVLSKSGLSHIFSISGTHFNILLLPVYFALIRIVRNKKACIALMGLICIVFLVITGFKTGALRSAIAFLTILFCSILNLDKNRHSVFSISIIINFLINPLCVYNTGFLMSYASVLSINLFFKPVLKKSENIQKMIHKRLVKSPRLSGKHRKFIMRIISCLLNSLSLVISVQPGVIFITYKLFHYINTFGLISNIIAIPFITPFVLSSWLCILIPRLFTPLFTLSFNIVFNISSFFSKFKYARIYLKDIHDLFFLSLILLIVLYSLLKNKSEILRIALPISVITAVISLIFSCSTKVVFFDVGQGDSALLSGIFCKKILFDTGQYINPSCIAYYAGNTLDAIFITHADADHCGGLVEILENINVKRIYMPDTELLKNEVLIKTISKDYPHIDVMTINSGHSISDGFVEISVLNPVKGVKYKNLNDASTVLNVKINDTKILITGDANIASKSKDKDLKCDIVKMPHHGDDKVITQENIHLLSASDAIISCGKNNIYGHPKGNTLNYLTKENMAIYRTDLHGGITVFMYNGYYKIFKYSELW